MKIINTIAVLLFLLTSIPAIAQQKNYYQTDFSKEEFASRRAKVFDAIGNQSIAVIQGSGGTPGVSVFRQSNSFYYLTGVESPHAYLLLNGRNKRSTLYLPHRNEGMENNQGKVLSAEDADLVKELTGIDQVKGIEFLASDLSGTGLIRPPAPALFVEFSPVESGNDSRDELLAKQVMAASDPWDGAASREAAFIEKLQSQFPQFEIKDLTPILDGMRLIKSEKEIEIIREATQIAGLAIIEAMKSTEPGVYEYQLGAAAKYIFTLHGAMGDSYPAIIGGGTNGYMGHYFHKTDKLVDGDLVLMDYAPDFKYYSSDVTRIWPVNGKFTEEQRALYEFIVAYRDALFRYIKPGVTSNEVLDQAAAEMKEYMVGKTFVNPAHLKAVEEGIKFRGHFQHPVGMTVHDVGRVHGVELQPGMVFTIDPMIWIREERLYIRIEDVAVVTVDGVENLSAFVPISIEEVEKTIAEKGMIELRPAVKLPLVK
ncbi:Xaa-Pro peptidase family protein [Algoriphagus sp. C2-6-M1]|uniref:Xaa-Pro peptidase family protein n=1 Tax=Algoriphagus persicinus TaxID=3108754 RepID=UPI002B37DB67|nr:Xaa-Pro peptidase family protein [Algoriphagus sp. C2-6-M1]MEB2782478.1 Xaa-Pro peptidase family protein [Algoriphagus sp. C2-6-M1]